MEKPRLSGAFPVLSRGAIAGGLIQVASIGMALGLRLALIRLIGATEYGLYVYAISWLDVLVVGVKLGLDSLLVRFVATYGSQQEWGLLKGLLRRTDRTVLFASLAVGAVVAAIGLALRQRIGDTAAISCMLFFGLLPAAALIQLRSATLRARKRVMWAIGLNKLVRPLLLLALFGGISLLGVARNGANALACDLIATLIALVVGAWILKRELPPEVATAAAEYSPDWLRIGFFLMFASCMSIFLGRTDVLMLGMLRDTTEAGVYETCSQISRLPLFGLTAVSVILGPMVAELFAQNRLDRLRQVLRLAARGILLFSVLASLGIVLLGEFVLSVFDPTFAVGYTALLWLAGAQLVNAAAGPIGLLLTMTGYERAVGRVLFAVVILNFVLNAVLIPPFGMVGAAVATAVSSASWNIAMLVVGWKQLGIRTTAF